MSKTLQEYMNLPYTIIVRRDKRDEIFVARVEELPGCSAHGDTEQESLANLRDNMEVWIADSINSGDAVPEPAEEIELPSGKWLQRVPRSLHLKLIRLAKSEGVSLNQLVTSALAEAVGSKEVRAEHSRIAAFEVQKFNANFLGNPCSGVVGNYNVKNEIGLSHYVPFESETYLTEIQFGVGRTEMSNQERRPHAEKRSQASLTSADQYLKFIKSVHLTGLGMEAASFTIDREAFAASFAPPKKPSATISGRHAVVRHETDSFVVIVEYTVSVVGNSASEVVNISCKYSAQFSLENETDQACIKRFSENEVQLVFWPYLRHFVSDCTYRMGIYPLVLPLTSEIAAPKN